MKTTFKRFLPLLAVCLVALTAFGATVQWYSQQPVTTALKNTDVVVLETTGPQGYKSFTLLTLRNFIGTNPPAVTIVNVSITTNAYISYLTNNYQYVTNQFVTFSFVTNLTAVNNSLTFITNNILYSTNIFVTNASLTFITNNTFWSTNATINNITNQNTTVQNTFNVNGKATLTVVNTLATTATNGFFVLTNSWSGGPTGTVDLSYSDQGYRTLTPLSITGFINTSNTVVESVVLSVTNAASTNILLTLPSGLRIPERTNQVAVSNASVGILSIRYHPAFGTNGVYRQF